MLHFRTVVLLLAALAFCPVAVTASSDRQAAIKLNPVAFDFARDLIAQGRFIGDKKGSWNADHPTRSRENDVVRARGFTEYGKWFLAIDERHPSNSKARYKLPFGDFRNVHRCGLLAVKARAHEYGYAEIEAAAARLLEALESAGPRSEKRID
jgi:hypothetical protein